MNNIPTDWRKFENAKFMLPILGLTFTIVFEIGFFIPIGLGWFLLFSLTDHVLFALTAAPFVVVVAICCYMVMWPIWSLLKYLFPKSGDAQSTPTVTSISRKRYAVWFSLASAGILLSLLQLYFLGFSDVLLNSAAGLIFVGTLLLFFFGRNWIAVQVTAVFLNATIVFGFGVFVGTALGSGDNFPYTLREKSGAVVRGNLLAAGDRGVLFLVAPTSATVFRRWELIESIERERHSLWK